jgi:hypothetical protein
MPYDIRRQRDRVEAWSTQRLPSEPKGWQRELRDGIRKALLSLDNSDALYARYSSQARDRADAENVLFCNVGTSSFSRLSRRRIVFERSFETPGMVWPHHSLYTNDGLAPRLWRRGEEHAAFQAELAPQGARPPQLAASFVWAALKRAQAMATTGSISGTYGLSVTLYAPSGAHLVLAAALKGVFDGVISAYQCHDGTRIDEVSRRLAAILFADKDNVSRLLMDSREAVLGSTRLIWPFRSAGVQWRPADDLCVAGELSREDSAMGWGITGSLYEVEAA